MAEPTNPRQNRGLIPMDADPTSQNTIESQQTGLNRIWERLRRLGLGDSAMRFMTAAITLVLILVVVGVVDAFNLPETELTRNADAALADAGAEPAESIAIPAFAMGGPISDGIDRQAELHTVLPVLTERQDVIRYTVEAGDSIFSIAEKFNLKPETILWGNRYSLGDNPHYIVPGQVLNILPVDGVYHMWSAGEGLNGVASVYGVTPEDIINWPGNDLDPDTIGDYADPNIAPDTMLVIPGGTGTYTDWSTPRITRSEPATAKYLGPGACTSAYDGIVGTGTFVWPTTEHYLSGYDYTPETNHFGIDIAGNMGNPIYASDSGVVTYAGWNDYGYGEMIVIDHGSGWQTLYAHLSQVNVSCGQEVNQGDTIGLMGSTGQSTGPHLHFEMRNDDYGRVNPWDFLIP
ncbi:MAG: peptidoglycan DD-metalloendopeptidase family protein [Anaerolineaceae bacterium]|nr:peptidoglycan DD-metalloendopeptidase family protein [Anaerolineaceae bacterium]